MGQGYDSTELKLMGDRDLHIAFTYTADPLHINDDLHPYLWYKTLVVSGAGTLGLPESRIRHPEKHATIEDPDLERVGLHMATFHSQKA